LEQTEMTTETETRTFSATEACRIAGITYRMLDHWIRTGCISIADDAEGSGSRRRFTTEELCRLVHVVERYNEAQEMVMAFRSGELWKSAEVHCS
jgi:hypothetical protein